MAAHFHSKMESQKLAKSAKLSQLNQMVNTKCGLVIIGFISINQEFR